MVEEEIGKELEMIEMNNIELNHKLRKFLEQEARSCSKENLRFMAILVHGS